MPSVNLPTGGVWKVVLVVAVVVGVGAAAFVAYEGGPGDETPQFGDQATAQVAGIDGINATVVTVIERENETVRTVERVSLRPGSGHRRARLVNPNETDREYELTVSNGSVRTLYDRDDEAFVIDLTRPDREGANATARLGRLLERLDRASDDDADRTTPGVEPLPAVPSTSADTGPAATAGGPLAVNYTGTETVAGRSAYRVELTSTRNDSAMVGEYTQRLWLDSERYYPLKRQTTWVQDGERTTITTTLRNVTFDPGLDADLFRFDPTADTDVSGSDGPDTWTYDTVALLRADTNWTVPDPDLPESYTLEHATRTRSRRVNSIGLSYANATGTIDVSKSDMTWYEPRTDGDTVDVGDVDAEFRNLGPEQRVSWTCPNHRYSVSASGVEKSVLVDVAASIECE